MALPSHFDSLEQAVVPERPLHLAIGMFDGVHRGHRAVIDNAIRSARNQGGVAAVLTFWPHPSHLFQPKQPTRLIMASAVKTRLLLRLGVETVITQPFTPDFARIEAESFLAYLKQKLPTLQTVYVGENWRFGRGRRGDVAMLIAEGKKLGLTVFDAPRVHVDGEPISSTRIRDWLESGEIAAANMALGYAYFAEGAVIPGKKLGRTIGFPTLNLAWSPQLRPRFGVYAVRVRFASEIITGTVGNPTETGDAGVANYGLRPTVEQTTEPLLETHMIGHCRFKEGDNIAIEWLRFLRPEKKFASLDELKAAIARDVEVARKTI